MTAIVAAASIALTGCGGQRATQSDPHGTGPRGPSGSVLLVFKRSIGVDPLASYFTLYTSGRGVATIVYGGKDGAKSHNFALSKARLQHVVQLLHGARLRDTGIVNPNLYTYWVITPRSSHRLSQAVLPRSSRPLIGELNAIADASDLF